MGDYRPKESNEFRFENVIGESFSLLFQNFVPVIAPAFIFFLITSGLSLLPVFFPELTFDFGDADHIFHSLQNGSFELLFPFIYFILEKFLSVLLGLILIERISRLYLNKDGGTIFENLNRTKNLILPFIGLQLLLGIIILAGTLFLIIPGIIFSLALYISESIMVLENKSITQSIKRSWNLTNGRKGTIFLLNFILVLIVIVLIFIPNFIFGMVTERLLDSDTEIIEQLSFLTRFLVQLGDILANVPAILTTPLQIVFMVSVYYNILKETEGFFTKELAESFLSDNPESEEEADIFEGN